MFQNKFMIEALTLAKIAGSEGEVPVGALIVLDGKIIAKAYNLVERENCATNHAEFIVLREASRKLKCKYLFNCDLFVTLEPCPLCAAAISMFKVRRLFYGAKDIKLGAVESVTSFFNSKNCLHKPEVYSGIYEEDASILMKEFFQKIREHKTGE